MKLKERDDVYEEMKDESFLQPAIVGFILVVFIITGIYMMLNVVKHIERERNWDKVAIVLKETKLANQLAADIEKDNPGVTVEVYEDCVELDSAALFVKYDVYIVDELAPPLSGTRCVLDLLNRDPEGIIICLYETKYGGFDKWCAQHLLDSKNKYRVLNRDTPIIIP